MSLTCPDCAAPLPTVVAGACPACGLPLRGPAAGRLWEVDQDLAALRAERTGLIAALRAAAASAGGPDAIPGALPTPARTSVRRPSMSARWSPQQLLLAAGVVLLLTAAIVFVAIGWTRFGVGGQCALLLAATGGAVAVSRVLAGRGLRASTEAVAVLAVGLAALDLEAAQRLGLVDVDAARYDVAATVLLCGLCAAAAWLVPLSTAYPVAAVLAGAAVPLAVLALPGEGLTRVAVVAAAAVLAGTAGTLLAHRARHPLQAPARVVLLLATAAWSLVGWTTGVTEAYLRPINDGGALASAAVVGVAAGLLVLARGQRLPRPARRVARLGLAAVGVTAAAALAHHGGHVALVALSVGACAVVAAVTLTAVARGRRTDLLVGGGTALAYVSGLAAELEPGSRGPGERALWLGALALAAGLVAGARSGGRRAIAAGAAGTTLVAAVFCAVADLPSVVRVAALLLVVVGLTVAAGSRRGTSQEPALATAAVIGALAALTLDADRADVAPQVAVVLAACGLLALGYSTLRSRGWVCVAGVLLCSAATWTVSADASVDVIEVYTMPLAVLALGVGAVRLRRYPRAPSWTTVGPGVSAALLPSAVASVTDDGLTRPLLVLLAAVLATLAGTALRWQAPVITGALAATVVAVSQLGPYAVAAPRWASLALGGAVLLSLGARYEQRRRDARDAASWLAALR